MDETERMVAPVRLRLSRAKGFDLQALSRATNGLKAVKVARPGPFGNPYTLQDAADVFDCRKHSAHEYAVQWFREWIETPAGAETFDPCHVYDGMAEGHAKIHAALPSLRGKNLACFCAPEFACHADVLLELANNQADEINAARDEGVRHGT